MSDFDERYGMAWAKRNGGPCPTVAELMGRQATKPAGEAPGTRAGQLLAAAKGIVDGARNQTHGDKERSFNAIANLWNAYLDSRKAPEAGLSGADVCALMVLLKFARSAWGQHVEDHAVDAAGYAAIWGELRELETAAPASLSELVG